MLINDDFTHLFNFVFTLLDESNTKKGSDHPNEKETDLETSHRKTLWSVIVSAPPWMKDFAVVALFSSSDSFLLWLESSDASETCENHGILCCYVESRREYLINV